MTSITGIAMKFFEDCETGKGWEGCKEYCKPGATFSAQSEPLADTRTLQPLIWYETTSDVLVR